jgi:predicted acetyltransferase
MPGTGSFDVRSTAPAEWRSACDTMRAALLSGPVSDDDWTKALPGWEDHLSISAWDGDRCVGHAGAFRFETVVPGGARLPTAGVTRVGVLPTATRQGLLSRMMRELLFAARHEGRVLASLRASEAVIYRRFGFGIAADGVSVTVDSRRARPLPNLAPGSIRVLARAEILEVVPAIYDRVADRPGVIFRPTFLWQRYLEDALGGDKASFVAVHTSPDGVDDGFVHFTVAWTEGPGEQHGKGEVHDLWGADASVELALWDHLLGIDLVRTYEVEERPVDDVLRVAVHDRRAYRTTDRYDEQWLRLLDVAAALSARTYAAGPSVRIAVRDPLFADNDDVFEIAADGLVSRSTAAPDLSCDVDAISAAFLGSTPWWDLFVAGRVAGERDAVSLADQRFATRPQAFCGSFF